MSLEEVLSLTIPQLRILEECLVKICNTENGIKDKEKESNSNTQGFAEVARMLKKETGRDSFTIQECMSPMDTIKKYKKV